MQDNNEDDFMFDFITNNVDENQKVDSIPNGVFKVSARTGYRKYEGSNPYGSILDCS